MDNGIDPKPNYLELDEERSKLLEMILGSSSSNARLYSYLNYFLKILSFNRSNIEEAFLSEFLEDYLNVVKRYEVCGNDPELTRKIFEQLLIIKERTFAVDYTDTINETITRLESKWTDLTNILNGIENNPNAGRKAYFPVIDNEAPFYCYGLIDTVTVRINKTDLENKFIIIPSEKEIEQRIEEQIKISWQLAIGISKKYVRKHNLYHEVIISFDKKAGFYIGNSLGIALTLTFLEQILKFYNPTYLINISEGSAFTGGIDTEGNVLNTGEDIIKRKVAAIFYSELNSFVIPKLEESYAYFSLEQLKKVYPERKLKLITAEDINDILNRRDLVEIKKQKAIVRTVKFVKKNWVSTVATVLLAILFAYLFVMDFDDNPASLSVDTNTLYVKNKNGKVLWTLCSTPNLDVLVYPGLVKIYARILDINKDGENELLFVPTGLDERNEKRTRGTIICYDKYQKIKWEYTFQDTVFSEREKLLPLYDAYLIDTTTIENKKVLLCYANNATSFSSAIFVLDLITGHRIMETQWNSGYTWDAKIVDFEGDGEKEIIAIGADNGYKDGTIWAVRRKNLRGFRPTTPAYIIKNIPVTELIFYIRIPKTDYDSLNGSKVNGFLQGGLSYYEEEKEFRFTSISSMDNTQKVSFPSINYVFNLEYMEFEIKIIDKFSTQRDEQIRAGALSTPYTDTEEYKEIIKNNILYWKGGQWVKRKDI